MVKQENNKGKDTTIQEDKRNKGRKDIIIIDIIISQSKTKGRIGVIPQLK